jgi:hypothetical protein
LLSFFSFHSPNAHRRTIRRCAKLRISPKPPRTYRTGIAFIMVIADERVAVIARAVLARTPLQPHFSSGPTHADIDAQGVVRAAM